MHDFEKKMANYSQLIHPLTLRLRLTRPKKTQMKIRMIVTLLQKID